MRDAIARFDGAAAWAQLTAERQAEIGALALEVAVASVANDISMETVINSEEEPISRAHQAAFDQLMRDLQSLTSTDCGDLQMVGLFPPLPARLGMVCDACGCSEFDPCEEGCGWAADGLCTACEAKGELR